MEKRKKKKSHLEPLSGAAQAQDTELHLKGSNMGFYHKWWLNLVAMGISLGLEIAGSNPSICAGVIILPSLPSQLGGIHVSGRTDAWDPHFSSDRTRVSGGPARGARLSGQTGPACQVGPTRGTCVSGWTDVWDPCVRLDQVRPTRGTCVSGQTDAWDLHVRLV
jgi:hypothetical protein